MAARWCWWKASFNPRPSFLAGEPSSQPCGPNRTGVSIHARHFWRASQEHAGSDGFVRCFNPRPSFLAGEPGRGEQVVQASGGFNPRPSFLAGEPRRLEHQRDRPGGFNPRPSYLAGEPGPRGKWAEKLTCFNPRPSFLAGEPLPPGVTIARERVSIHARHFWRASRRSILTSRSRRLFQSTPVISGGRATAVAPTACT